MVEKMRVVIITGMSGAGKTVAVHSLEDLGYFVFDNMLPNLAEKFVDVMEKVSQFNKVAMVMDSRSQGFYDQVLPSIQQLKKREDLEVSLLFLDAADDKLISRYKETRRSHPLSPHGRLLDGVTAERKLLNNLKSEADIRIDTTSLTPRNLKLRLNKIFGHGEGSNFYIEVMSFGFKYGLPLDADIVLDVRFLPNPYYVDELKNKTGDDQEVYDYVMKFDETKEFCRRLHDYIDFVLKEYAKQKRSHLTIAVGCTGGHHRSVTIANWLYGLYKDRYQCFLSHRDSKV